MTNELDTAIADAEMWCSLAMRYKAELEEARTISSHWHKIADHRSDDLRRERDRVAALEAEVTRLKRVAESQREDIEKLVWNLAGCETIASAQSPVTFSNELAMPALHTVNKMATDLVRLQTVMPDDGVLWTMERTLDGHTPAGERRAIFKEWLARINSQKADNGTTTSTTSSRNTTNDADAEYKRLLDRPEATTRAGEMALRVAASERKRKIDSLRTARDGKFRGYVGSDSTPTEVDLLWQQLETERELTRRLHLERVASEKDVAALRDLLPTETELKDLEWLFIRYGMDNDTDVADEYERLSNMHERIDDYYNGTMP